MTASATAGRKSRFRPALVLALWTLCWPAVAAPASPADSTSSAPSVMIGRITGPIGPITKEYVHRLLTASSAARPVCVIFTIDTPGGLDLSMRSIIKDILASPVPVVVYVYPSGARAASAGAFITLAAHVAAMAPGTNIGAAHPVAIGEGKMDEEMAKKITNDAAAYARGLAKKRGRDVQWAEQIVRESISSTAEEAKKLGVVDIIAEDIDQLLSLLDGFTVATDAAQVTLSTEGVVKITVPMTLRERLLAKISDPNIAYILMLLGIFGLIFELQNPGAIFPGVIGGISILLAFFALQLLPVSFTGLSLIIFSIILFLLEVKVPSGGLLTVGGIVSMVIGSLMFIKSPVPAMRVSIGVIIPAVIFTALFFLFAVGMGLKAQRKKVATGTMGIVGEVGVAKTDVAEKGSVFIHGEYWNAYSETPVKAGERVEVVAVDGMTLKVKPVQNKEVG